MPATSSSELRMRLWTLHPRFLDRQGLFAAWREGGGWRVQCCMARQTHGYRHHPQLERFRAQAAPEPDIDAYLAAVSNETAAQSSTAANSAVAPGVWHRRHLRSARLQWQHLLCKLSARSPELHERWRQHAPAGHPLFLVEPGPVATWERP